MDSAATTAPLQEASPIVLSATNVFYFLLIPTLVLWYVYWRVSRSHMIELAEKLPGPEGLPFLGNALDFIGGSPAGNANVVVLNFI